MFETEPSIYIVGGLPRTGKSTVAERLAHDLRIGSIETDHIRMLFIPTATSEISSSSGVDIEKVTNKLRPRLESLIGSLVVGKTSLVLNGECIDPVMVTESIHHSRIASCFMGLDDPEKAFTRIRAVTSKGDWTPLLSDDELQRVLEKYSKRSQILGKKCLDLGLPYVDASENFLTAYEQAYSFLNPQHTIVTNFMR